MDLTDYPTPKSDSLQPWDDVIDVEEFRDLEREAAAWRAVAEKFYNATDGEMYAACETFDALKSQVNP